MYGNIGGLVFWLYGVDHTLSLAIPWVLGGSGWTLHSMMAIVEVAYVIVMANRYSGHWSMRYEIERLSPVIRLASRHDVIS
jgi:hypothetical protein